MKKVIFIGLILIGIFILLKKITDTTMEKIEIGDVVPSFTLLDQNGNKFTVNNKLNRPIVIYFYPKDDTPGCTKEACKFRDDFELFSDLNALVIGISSDSVHSHKKFEEKYNLPFTLLADANNVIRKLFGVPKSMFILPGRVTYIINKKGRVDYIFNNQFEAEKHIEIALKKLKEQ